MSSDTRVSPSGSKQTEMSLADSCRKQGRGRGRSRGGSQGGPASGGRGGHGARGEDKPRREAILDLAKYTDKKICVKFTGGRQGKFLRPTES